MTAVPARLSAALLLLLSALLLARPAAAQEKRYALTDYDVDLALQSDGRYRVTETIRFGFQRGTFTHARRDIPTDYLDAIRDVSVQSADVSITSVEHEAENGEYRIRWTFPERSQLAAFTLHYTVDGALYTENEDNVIDWQAVGTEWDVPISDVDVRVSWPRWDLARDSILVAPDDEARLTATGSRWQAAFAHERLAPGEGYRVVVYFPERIAAPARTGGGPSPAELLLALLAGLGGLSLGVAALVRWGGASAEAPIGVSAAPDLSLPEAAYLRSNALGQSYSAFTAVLFDLARRGHLTLRRVEEKQLFGSREAVEIDVHPARGDALTDFERALLDEVRTCDTLHDFSKAHTFRQKQMQRVRQKAVEAGWVESHTGRSNGLMAAALLLAAASVAAIAVGAALGLSGSAVAIGAGLAGGAALGAVFAATQRYVLTEAGASRQAAVKAYLERLRTGIEAERPARPAHAAERFLRRLPWLTLDPKVDKRWVDDLKDALAESQADVELPGWLENAVEDDGAESRALVAFLPYYHVVMATSATTGAGTMAGVSAGAGAGGGAGGGGGGAG